MAFLGKDKGHNDAIDRGQWPQGSVFITEYIALGTAAGTVPPGLLLDMVWFPGEQCL